MLDCPTGMDGRVARFGDPVFALSACERASRLRRRLDRRQNEGLKGAQRGIERLSDDVAAAHLMQLEREKRK